MSIFGFISNKTLEGLGEEENKILKKVRNRFLLQQFHYISMR